MAVCGVKVMISMTQPAGFEAVESDTVYNRVEVRAA